MEHQHDDEQLEQAITDAMLDVYERRNQGEQLSDDDIVGMYPAIAEALLERLQTPLNPLDFPTVSRLERRHEERFGSKVPALKIQGYINIKELSRGGQATVFSAVQKNTGQRVAIKVIHGGRFLDDRAKQRFLREIKLLASLSHRNIVTIINQGHTDDGAAYLIMQYVDGLPVDEYVKQWRSAHPDEGPAPQALLTLFIKIARAVDAAHRRGVVHRDLKPSNILVDRYGEPCILDFGLARAAAGMELDNSRSLELTRTGQFLGSLPWASPEQAHGDAGAVDARSDVYSLGLLLYHMLAGTMPYKVTGSLHEVIGNIISAQPTPLSDSLSVTDSKRQRFLQRYKRIRRWHAVNPSLEAVVLLALAKSAEGRYDSAGAMATDLELYLSGEKTMAWHKLRKRTRRMSLVAVAVVALTGVIALANLPRSLTDPFSTSQADDVAPKNITRETVREQTARRQHLMIPAEAVAFNGHAYLVVENMATWDQARKTAELLGGHLAVISDRPELYFFMSTFMERSGGWRSRLSWLGMESDGADIFRTVTGERFDYRQWDERAGPWDKGIGGVATSTFLWRIVPKSTPLWFTVEWDYLPPRRPLPKKIDGFDWAVEHNGHRYFLVVTALKSYEAKKRCRDMGGELLCIETAEEEAFIRSMEQVRGMKDSLWLGANFYDGVFSWFNGRITTYRNWEHPPDDTLSTAVVMTANGWRQTMPEETTEGRHYFICEWEENAVDGMLSQRTSVPTLASR